MNWLIAILSVVLLVVSCIGWRCVQRWKRLKKQIPEHKASLKKRHSPDLWNQHMQSVESKHSTELILFLCVVLFVVVAVPLAALLLGYL